MHVLHVPDEVHDGAATPLEELLSLLGRGFAGLPPDAAAVLEQRPERAGCRKEQGVEQGEWARPERRQVGHEVAHPLHVAQLLVDRQHDRRFPDVRVDADASRQVLLGLVRREPRPVRKRVDACARGQLVVEPGNCELQRVRVAVVAVQQDDPREADVRQRHADIADDVHERIHAEVHEPVRSAVVVRDPERDRRPDDRLQLRRRSLRHLERNVDVRPERPVIAVILGRADGDDHRVAAPLEVLAHLEVRHLRHEERARHPYSSPSPLRCSRDRRIASVTSASGGHGSPWNSSSTEYGPS